METADIKEHRGSWDAFEKDFNRYRRQIQDLKDRKHRAQQLSGEARSVELRMCDIESGELRERIQSFAKVLSKQSEFGRGKASEILQEARSL